MTAVMILNASYEPLGTTDLGRAVALVLRGDAMIEEADPHIQLRSKSVTMPWPTVVRLLKYVKVPFQHRPATWSKSGVIRRDRHMCGYCGKSANELKEPLTVDHIKPRALGGKDTWDNTVAACKPCNSKKAAKELKDTGMTLLVSPHTPMRMGFGSFKT